MVIALIGILAGIAVPLYDNYREKVRVATAVLGIGVIAKEITGYLTVNGSYPASLADIGQDRARDPWGNAYQYLRIASADASAPSSSSESSSSKGSKSSEKAGSGSSSSGADSTGSSPQSSSQDAASLSKARKDHFMVPINTDYDLYSMGADGKSLAPLTAKASQDDIIRANDGLFIGRASEF